MFARLLVFVLLFGAVSLIARILLRIGGTVRCSHCEGKGYRNGSGERQPCDWCKGSGRMPRP